MKQKKASRSKAAGKRKAVMKSKDKVEIMELPK